MSDSNGAKTVKEKAILAQLAATGLQALHYYNHGISITLLLARTGPLTLTREGDVVEGGGELLVVSRGIAICSVRDQFSKKEGRLISLGRALKAYREQRSSKEVILRAYAGNLPLLDVIAMFDMDHITISGSTRIYKSCWMPELTEKEQALLKSRTRIKE